MQRYAWAACGLVFGLAAIGAVAQDEAGRATVWSLSRLDQVGRHAATVIGSPKLLDDAGQPGIEFDGLDDGLFVEVNPLQGLSKFTVEVIFRPAAGGPEAQRFLHFQETDSENRLLFETRLTPDGKWFLDTFLKSGDGNYTLFAERYQHPIGPWYHAAVVINGQTMQHYVNGQLELSSPIMLKPLGAGRTSLGVRINKVSWYKGAIRQVRITPRPLQPGEFAQP